MPRIARVVAPGLPHHITQRGNYGQDIFHDDVDRKQYLFWIGEYGEKYSVSFLVYCLMSNHVHFIVIPQKEDSLAKTFNAAHMRYSHYFNRKIGVTGHLWQGRYYSCVLDEPHLEAAAKYIERNPVRAKMVKKPWRWNWSSCLEHIGKANTDVKLTNIFDYIETTQDGWKDYMDMRGDKTTIDNIRSHTLTGRPLGAVEFVKKLEIKFDKRLVALSRGRPRIGVK